MIFVFHNSGTWLIDTQGVVPSNCGPIFAEWTRKAHSKQDVLFTLSNKAVFAPVIYVICAFSQLDQFNSPRAFLCPPLMAI